MTVKDKKTATQKSFKKESRTAFKKTEETSGSPAGKAVASKDLPWTITNENGDTVKIEVKNSNLYFFDKKMDAFGERVRSEDFSYSEVKPLIEFLEFNQKESAEFLEVDPGTISRWNKNPKNIGRLRSKNLLDIDELIAKGIRIFGSEDGFKEWLYTTNNALGDIVPISLLKDPYGVELVDEAIDSLSWGSFV